MNRVVLFSMILLSAACTTATLNNKKQVPEELTYITTNTKGQGPEIVVDFEPGEAFYYPLFAIWLEDIQGNYIQTLYVSEAVATGFFKYARKVNNRWEPGYKRAPQTLPYWAHKRGVPASDGLYIPDPGSAVPDAYSGPTPITGFVLTSRADTLLPDRFKVMLEINQNWDWNEYWTNDKFPEDENYKMSCQPALVYEAVINNNEVKSNYLMTLAGHSHYSGKTGELFTDLSTLTTALHIADSIQVRIKN